MERRTTRGEKKIHGSSTVSMEQVRGYSEGKGKRKKETHRGKIKGKWIQR